MLAGGDTPFWAEGLVGTYGNIINHKTSLSFEGTMIKPKAESLIRGFLTDATVRLGRNGIADIKAHEFFKTDEWDWDTLRTTPAPWTFEMKSETDTQNFEDVEENKQNEQGFPPARAWVGNQLLFVGFSYSHDPQWLDLNRDQGNKPTAAGDGMASMQGTGTGRRTSTNTMAAGDMQQMRKKLKAAEDQVRALELDQKSVLERKRLDEEQINKLERWNRELEETKRKLGREILDVHRNTQDEQAKFSQIKGEIEQLKIKENDLLQRQKQDQDKIRILVREQEDKHQKLQSEQDQTSKLRKELQSLKNAKNGLEAQIRDLNNKQKQRLVFYLEA